MFEVPVYWIHVVVVVHDDFNEVDRKYKLNLKDHYDDPNDCRAITTDGADTENGTTIYVLFKPSSLDMDTFGHEVAHVMSYICIHRGIEIDCTKDEPIAYLQGFVQSKIADILVRYMDIKRMSLRSFLTSKKK